MIISEWIASEKFALTIVTASAQDVKDYDIETLGRKKFPLRVSLG
jgi:hypothetical protein